MTWMPQQVSSSTATSTRMMGDMPELPAYEELDEDKLRSRTQEFSALGRREARGNFQDLLARLYGANPDDPYARNLARQASQGFSMDTQRAISAGAKEALGLCMSEQAQRNQRVMTAFQAAVNKVLGSATTTSTTSYDYEPQPMQTAPTMGMQPNIMQQALSKKFDPTNPLSLGQPYTYG